MTLWALSDPHLSFSYAKPMHVFGEHWHKHWEKIQERWQERVAPEDTVLVTGDISWAFKFNRAMADLEWLHALNGRHKLIVRGNHDLWWPTTDAERERLPPSLHLLGGTALLCDGRVFCGTGGWLSPNDPYFEPLDANRYRAELVALEQALEAGLALVRASVATDGREPGLHVLIHFPPYTSAGLATPFDALLRRYPVRTVTFGHFHLEREWAAVPTGEHEGIHYTLASADYLDFTPLLLPD